MPSANVSRTDCDSRHKMVLRWLALIVTAIAVLATSVGWATNAGHSARSAIKTHAAGQEQVEKRIDQSLTRIETELKDQRRMIEDLWKKNGQ